MGKGTGTPLLVINGGPGFAHGFLHVSNVWDQLADGRRLVFFDQPGTGQSWYVGPNDGLVVEDILRSIEAIREAVGAPRIAAERDLSADNPKDVQTYIRGRLAMSFYSFDVRDRVLAALGTTDYNARQETLLWKDAESHDLTENLKRLRMPVLVATGRFDTNVAPRTAWRIHQGIPGSQFVVWERSGHFPMIEEPDAFFAVVDRFLRGR